MFVNTNSLRIRKKDKTVIWVKRGEEIDANDIPDVMLRRLIGTDRLVEKMESKQKKAPKVENKIMPEVENKSAKASKKGASK